jgi:hypothetical protein
MSVGDYQEWVNLAEAQGSAGHDKDRCIGIFFDRAVVDKRESEKQGRQVHVNAAYCQILIPGCQNARVVERAGAEHRARFPAAWAAYEAKRQGLADGTPLEMWAYLTPAQVANLKVSGVFSVEHLAAVSDGNLPNIGMGAMDLRDRARQFLQASSETEQELRETIADQAARITDLEARIDQLVGGAGPAAADTKPARTRKAA